MHYYKRNLGDIAKKTSHLSPLEFGIYNLILDGYYAREKSPTLIEATRWARARTEDEKAAVLAVLDEFFTLEDGCYRQSRIEEELGLYHDKAEKNREIALAREEARRDRRQQDRGTKDRRSVPRNEHESCTTGSPEQHEQSTAGQPNHKPLTINQDKPSKAPAEPLPEWVPVKPWSDFMAMRKAIKKPLTPEAIPLAVKKLEKLRKAGHPPADVLNQSVMNSWQGLFELRPGDASTSEPAAKDWI